MIAIINRGPHDGDPGGVRNYELRINDEVLVTFQHYRKDGLATCLRRAAKAYDRHRIAEARREREEYAEKLIKYLEEFEND